MTDLFLRLQQALPRRYKLRSELGRGGMSVVFLADEAQPRRPVAIKVLDPEVAAHLGRERFLREVDLLSSLNHPHIVPIFAAGEVDSLLYYVMPYQSGQTLRDVLANGPLDMEFAIGIAREVADALEYAHSREVVHRDVKPENILISGGHAVVADFGIARAIAAAGDQSLTQAGIAVGTPAYMSPEQISSDELDGRSDVYSLGCVLYEMLTGQPPYSGDSARAVISRHSLDPVPSVRQRRPSVSVPLDAAVTRSLQKSPTDRFFGAGDFSTALETAATQERMGIVVTSGTASTISTGRLSLLAALVVVGALGVWWAAGSRSPIEAGPPSIAVLPLHNLGDSTLESTAVGFGHDISSRLAQDSSLIVKAHSSVRALVDIGLRSVRVIADSLGVDFVIDGVIFGQDDGVRVTAELIDAHTGRVMWTNQFDGTLARAHAFENDIVLAVVGTLSGGRAAANPNPRDITRSPGHDAYLRGVRESTRRTRGALLNAEAAFQEAIGLDSTLAPAYAELASIYGLSLHYRYDLGVTAYEAAGRGLAYADRAIELDPALPDAYSARGLIASASSAPTEIVRADFELALDLAPSSPSAAAWSGALLMREQRFDEALANSLRAVELDPRVPSRRLSVALQALQLRRYDLVVEHTRVADAFAPTLLFAREVQAMGLLLDGRAVECLSLDLGPHRGLRAACLQSTGNQADAIDLVETMLSAMEQRNVGNDGFAPALFAQDLAVYYAWTGDVESAMHWIATAFEQTPLGIDNRVLNSGLFDRVRDAPSFRDTLEQARGQVWNRVNGERRRYISQGES